MKYKDINGNKRNTETIFLKPHCYCDRVEKMLAENCSAEEAERICSEFNGHYEPWARFQPVPSLSYEETAEGIVFTQRDPYDD